MQYDANVKRITFIGKSTSIREAFKFADPTNILQAVQVYAGDAYGAMLWDLYGVKAKQYFNTWNTCVKLCWEVPRGTHTYFVEKMLAFARLQIYRDSLRFSSTTVGLCQVAKSKRLNPSGIH